MESKAGDPFQVVVVPVAGRHPLFPVIGDGPLGEVTHFRIPVRIGVEAAGRGGSPDPVKPHSQRIRDVPSSPCNGGVVRPPHILDSASPGAGIRRIPRVDGQGKSICPRITPAGNAGLCTLK